MHVFVLSCKFLMSKHKNMHVCMYSNNCCITIMFVSVINKYLCLHVPKLCIHNKQLISCVSGQYG